MDRREAIVCAGSVLLGSFGVVAAAHPVVPSDLKCKVCAKKIERKLSCLLLYYQCLTRSDPGCYRHRSSLWLGVECCGSLSCCIEMYPKLRGTGSIYPSPPSCIRFMDGDEAKAAVLKLRAADVLPLGAATTSTIMIDETKEGYVMTTYQCVLEEDTGDKIVVEGVWF